MIGEPEKPGCVVPSMVTGSVTAGSAAAGEIVFGPDPMEKRIVSAPAAAFAALIASRSVQFAALQRPSSVSAVELTVKVAAASETVESVDRIRAADARCAAIRRRDGGVDSAPAPTFRAVRKTMQISVEDVRNAMS
jgi:hypothetical protein